MPTLEPHEQLELEWKLAQMEADVELKKAQTLKVKQDWRLDPQRVLIQAVIATAGVFTAIAGVVFGTLGYFIGRGH